MALRNWLLASETKVENGIVNEIVGVTDKIVKCSLEKLCVPHEVILNNLRLVGDEAHIFAFCLGLQVPESQVDSSGNVLEATKIHWRFS